MMEKKVVLVLVIFVLKALSQRPDVSTWIAIDCGSLIPSSTLSHIQWQTDAGFIKTDVNQLVQDNPRLPLLNSLRAFTTQNKNCHTLPASQSTRYFIRASFNYGNYDGLQRPPTFDLQIDGNKWVTILSSELAEIIYHEAIYTSKGDNISICLAKTQTNQNPFISTLELWPIPDAMYSNMNRSLAWFKTRHLNYGASDVILGYPDDWYNRIWDIPKPPPNTSNLSTITDLVNNTSEYPSERAILDAVETLVPSSRLLLSFDDIQNNSLNYIEAYFSELESSKTEIRLFEFYVDDIYVAQKSGPSITIKLNSTQEATLPPIINAIEVYTASDPLVTTTTSQDDLDGLAVLIRTFYQLIGWAGDPCLPSDMPWQWVGCSGTDPPRVTSIHLSGYHLLGTLPDFSQMTDLQTIDLSNNLLTGPIPEFLGNFPNLTLLNLENNLFYSGIPQNIFRNKNIKYYVYGNSYLDNYQQNSKKTSLIIGLVVGIVGAKILLVTAIVFYRIHKRNLANTLLIAQGSGGSQIATEDNATSGVSMVPLAIPSSEQNYQTLSSMLEPEGEGVLVHSTDHAGHVLDMESVNVWNHGSQMSMVPDMDMEELDLLLQQHGSPQEPRRT